MLVGKTLDAAGAVVEREISGGVVEEKREGGGGVSSFLDREVKDLDLETALNDGAGVERGISRVLVEDKRVAASSFFERDVRDDLATAVNVDEGVLERETFSGFVGGKLDSRKEMSSFSVNEVNERALPTEVRGVVEVAVDLYVPVG